MSITDLVLQSMPVPDAAAKIYANEYTAYIETLDMISEAREQFFEAGEILPFVRPEIAESWQRCRKAGLTRHESRLTYLSGNALDERLRQNAYLIRIASPVIRSVYQKLSSASCLCATYLTDSEGVVLDFIKSEIIEEDINHLGLCIGVKWDEDAIGTNAISLALQYRELFYTYAPEHYLDDHTFVNCVTAPIHSNENEIVGTITVTFYKEYYNDFLMAVISTAAELIETQFLNLRYLGIIDYTLNDASEGVLILDTKLRVIQVNNKFRQLIREPSAKEASMNVSMLFKNIDFDAVCRDANLHTAVRETFLSYKNVYTRVSVDIYRIDTYGTADGFILTCRDIGDIIKLSQQFIGSPTTFRFENIVTQNPQMLSIIKECKQVANSKCPILLEGESGTGKEMFAQSIHNASSRASKPFVAVNCAALPISLVESELFGYEKGAFTDGLATGKAGKFELSNGGTIFLDEIGELSLDVQVQAAARSRQLPRYPHRRHGGKEARRPADRRYKPKSVRPGTSKELSGGSVLSYQCTEFYFAALIKKA